MKNLKYHLIPIILIFSITLFAFRDLPKAFFEQDEWHTFGHYIYLQSLSGGEFLANVFRSGPLSHFTPLSLFSKMGMYQLFGLNAYYYFLISIFLHVLVSLSVYFLLILLIKKRLPALLGALFFAVNSTHYQAVIWLGTFEGVLGATLFGLLSIICFIIYTKKKQIMFLYATFVFLLISLLFKEIALSFTVFMGFLFFMSSHLSKRKLFTLLIATVSLYFLLRFSYLIFGINPLLSSPGQMEMKGIAYSLLYNLLLIPKLFSQITIPNDFLNFLSEKMVVYFEQFGFELSSPWVGLNELSYDAVSILAGLFLLIFFILVFIKNKEGKNIYLGLVLLVATILPLLLLRNFLVFLDSRFFYPGTIGVSIILGALISNFTGGKNVSFLKKSFILFLFATVLVIHFIGLNAIINEKVKLGQERKAILTQIKSLYPDLPNKTIIFTQSDKPLYGLSERILPFQSGFGQTLLVWYYSRENFPKEFFSQEFLWGITDQGYKEIKDRGFGYFLDFNLMAKTIKDNNIPLDSIFSFRYDSDNKSLEDNTQEVRGRILSFLSQKKAIINFALTGSNNTPDLSLVVDQDRETFWSSKVPYSQRQFIEIELTVRARIAQITLDSYNNKDQNEVGYSIFLSENGEDWQRVFYSKRYPPSNDGMVNLYFQPQTAKYIKIEQAGFHQFAPWVIHDLKIYEEI